MYSLLREKSHGVPSWCEQLLTDLFYDNVLTIIPADEKEGAMGGRRESSVTPDHANIAPRIGPAASSTSFEPRRFSLDVRSRNSFFKFVYNLLTW